MADTRMIRIEGYDFNVTPFDSMTKARQALDTFFAENDVKPVGYGFVCTVKGDWTAYYNDGKGERTYL